MLNWNKHTFCTSTLYGFIPLMCISWVMRTYKYIKPSIYLNTMHRSVLKPLKHDGCDIRAVYKISGLTIILRYESPQRQIFVNAILTITTHPCWEKQTGPDLDTSIYMYIYLYKAWCLYWFFITMPQRILSSLKIYRAMYRRIVLVNATHKILFSTYILSLL